MKKQLIILLVAMLGTPSFAQDSKFLNKNEAQPLVVGKVWNMQRVADKMKVRLDFRKDGTLYGNNYSSNSSDSGTWSINEAGQVCFVWRGRFTGGCRAVLRTAVADKRQLVDVADSNVVLADFTIE